MGRERELAEIRLAIQDASSGRGRMLLFSGEPGIGKTCLADQAASYAASRGMRVAWGRCWEGGGAPPFWPWIQILRELIGTRRDPAMPQIPEPVRRLIPEPQAQGTNHPEELHYAEHARFRLFDSIATFLKQLAGDRSMMIVLDDLHESDQASLLMLRFLSRELGRAPILLMGTYREAEIAASPSLQELIGELVHEGHQIPLRGLSEAEVSELVEIHAGRSPDSKLIARLHHATNGNPLFVEGVARMLSSEGSLGPSTHGFPELALPDGVREAIRRRIGALPESTRVMLTISSVLGNEFEFDPLTLLTKLPEEQLNSELSVAMGAGIVLAISGRRYRFAHALIRDEVYIAIPQADRSRIHREMAGVLEELHESALDRHLAALAHHYREAGVADKAAYYSLRAGRAAENVSAFEEAISQYEAGLELAENLSDQLIRARLLIRVGIARMLIGIDRQRGIRQCEEAIDLFEKLALREEAGSGHAGLALQLSKDDDENLTDLPRAMVHLGRAEEILGQGSKSESLILLLLGLSVASWKALEVTRAMDVTGRGLDLTQHVKSLERPSFYIIRSHVLAYQGRIAEVRALVPAASEPSLDRNVRSDLINRARFAKLRGEIPRLLWDPGEGVRWLSKGLADPDVLETAHLVRHALAEHLGFAYVISGDLAEGRRRLSEVRSKALAGLLSLYGGDWREAANLLRESLSIAQSTGSRVREADATLWLAQALRVADAPAKARAVLEHGLRRFGNGELPLIEMWLRPEFVLLLAREGEIAEAKSQLARCDEITAAVEDWLGLVGHVARAKAVVARAEGKLQEAESQFETAVRIFQRYTLPWEEADALYHWGRALIAANLNSRGGEKFAAAIEIYRRHGAGQRWVDRVEADRIAGIPRSGATGDIGTFPPIFRKEGEYWTLEYQGGRCRLRDSRGLQFIANLIGAPGREVRASDLANSMVGPQSPRDRHDHQAATVAGNLGDTGAILDGQAKLQYRLRLRELRAELEEAEGNNDLGRAESARGELEAIENQLASALGLGGRDRKSHAHSERARWMVTNSIKRAIAKIDQINPPLGRHLHTCVRTGNFCSYTPDPEHPVAWQL